MTTVAGILDQHNFSHFRSGGHPVATVWEEESTRAPQAEALYAHGK